MSSNLLLFPMLALVLLTLSVLFATGLARKAAVKAGRVDPKFYRLFQGDSEPDEVRVLQRNFQNLLETPMLFYIGCVSAMALQLSSSVLIVLAWLYVFLRFAHSYVHLFGNRVPRRLQVFLYSLIALLVFWLSVVIVALMQG